jgi:hypothetical protein
VAALQGGGVQFFEEFPPAVAERISRLLRLTGVPALREELLADLNTLAPKSA